MQRLLLAAIAALAVAGLVGATGYSAEPPDADVGAPAAAPPAGEISVQPPRDLRDIALAAKPRLSERRPSVVANPKHPERLALAVVQGEGDERCVVLRSDDSGRTWSAPVPLPKKSADTCRYVDLAYAPDGSLVYAAYDVSGLRIVVSSSTDDGITWRRPVVAVEDSFGDRSFLSPNIATSASEADAKWVYLSVQSRFADPGTGISLTSSGDRGLSWSPERGIASGDSEDRVDGGRLAGGLGGEVVVAYFESDYWVEPGIRVARSSDHGTTFTGRAIAASGDASDPDIKIGALGVAHVAFAKRSGNFTYDVGYVWSAGPPYTTWSEPVTVNHGGFRRDQKAASLALQRCGTTTVLHVIWNDARLSPVSDPERYQDVFYARKLAKTGATWSKNIRISDESSFRDGGFYIAKQPELAVSAGRLFATWTDRRDKASTADTETDVYGSGILRGITCP